jgi:uncharacterized protein YuzE
MLYFAEGDILHLMITEGGEINDAELSPDITAELSVQGEVIGIESLDAGTFMRNTLIQGVQASI